MADRRGQPGLFRSISIKMPLSALIWAMRRRCHGFLFLILSCVDLSSVPVIGQLGFLCMGSANNGRRCRLQLDKARVHVSPSGARSDQQRSLALPDCERLAPSFPCSPLCGPFSVRARPSPNSIAIHPPGGPLRHSLWQIILKFLQQCPLPAGLSTRFR